ncbi:MAG: cytochrome c family protein, partial [Gemmataceae bacterium]|nr:cytochrome c family protein [Gemmataceae bacterium]
VGVAVCQDCHDQEDPTRKRLYQETRGYEFIRLRENLVWAAYDPHSQAFKNLATAGPDLNPTAKRMEDRLRPTRGPGYTVAADVQCLACHASTLRPGVGREAASFATADGVGCEMCHGHGSKYRDVHQESKLDQAAAPPGAVRVVPWRDWDPAKKHAEYGLVNLRDPGTAAARCASCHVGNPAEGRFVTHEMYAAGHPPLPPFDLSAYAREQPRHWGLPGDMPYITRLAGRDPTRAWAVFHHRAGESAAARRLAEGAVASLRATLDLTGQLAAADTAGGGLDYAAFDCYSCHHDLKYPSDRQARGYVGPPGRPLFRPAPFALARLVVGHAAGLPGGEGLKGQAEALLAAEKELAGAFGARTFGDPALIRPAAEKAKAWCDRVLTGLHGVKYDRAAAAGLLAKVVEAGQGKVADPEVAQLYAWAFETLELDLDRRKDPKVPPPSGSASGCGRSTPSGPPTSIGRSAS